MRSWCSQRAWCHAQARRPDSTPAGCLHAAVPAQRLRRASGCCLERQAPIREAWRSCSTPAGHPFGLRPDAANPMMQSQCCAYACVPVTKEQLLACLLCEPGPQVVGGPGAVHNEQQDREQASGQLRHGLCCLRAHASAPSCPGNSKLVIWEASAASICSALLCLASSECAHSRSLRVSAVTRYCGVLITTGHRQIQT